MRELRGVLIWVLLASLAAGQELVNGGFEEHDGTQARGWRAYGAYTLDTATRFGGGSAIRCEVRNNGRGGAMQEIVYEKPDKRPILFGGWCKTEGAAADYCCIFLDIWYEGGGNAWAIRADWPQADHDWVYTAELFHPEKPVAKIQYFVFLREGQGRAWFDELTLERREPALDIKRLEARYDFPFTARGAFVTVDLWKKARWRATVSAPDAQNAEEFSGHGARAEFQTTSGAGATLHFSAVNDAEEIEKSLPLPDRPRARVNSVKQGYAIWCADSMRRVTPLTYPSASELESPAVELHLARNESESAQIQLTTAADTTLDNVTIAISPLMDSAGIRFDGSVAWQRVGYVPRQWPHHAHPEEAAMDEQWLPDPLLPPAPFKVRASATQGVWLTARTTAGTLPGIYKGVVTISAPGRPLGTLPLTLHVHDFSNPDTFGMRTAFCVMDGFTKAQYPERFEEMRRKSIDLMLSYRLNPDDISRTEPPRIEDLLYARERGLNCFNILNLVPEPTQPVKWSCYAPLSVYTPAFYERLKARLTPYVAELRKHGLEKLAYLYGFDERQHDYYPAIGELWRNLQRDFPDIPVMTTAMMYRDMVGGKDYPDQDITDWFCPLSSVYKPELSDRLRAQGRQVWWYVCCGPTTPHANFASMEYPPVEGRLLGWLTYRYQADGLLYWHVNYWQGGPTLDGADTFLPTWQAINGLRMPGDGQLLYPGVDGPWPSIRLANVRDGIEDYEWLQLLEQREGRAAADSLAGEITRGMTDFERSPEALRAARRRLAARLARHQAEGRRTP